MRRTVERLQIGLDAKERMPDEVRNARDQEQANPKQREPVAGRQGLAPWRTLAIGHEGCAGQHERSAQHPAVDDRGPGRKVRYPAVDAYAPNRLDRGPQQTRSRRTPRPTQTTDVW